MDTLLENKTLNAVCHTFTKLLLMEVHVVYLLKLKNWWHIKHCSFPTLLHYYSGIRHSY